jgi:PHYB activation tagged suppressor 1
MASSVALSLIVLIVLAVSWIWEYVVVRLIWRPYAIAKMLRGQGIHGPPYKFLKGSNEEEKRLKAEAAGARCSRPQPPPQDRAPLPQVERSVW